MDNEIIISVIITGVIILAMIILSCFLLAGRGAWNIAGYNTMPEEKKMKYDKAALCKFIGKITLCISISMIAVIVGLLIPEWLTVCVIGFFVITVGLSVFAVIYANTKNRFIK